MDIKLTIKKTLDALRDEKTRWDAILEFKLLDCRQHLDIVMASMQDPDWIVRWAVAEKLGEFASIPVMYCLIKSLGDPDPHVQKNVMASLVKFRRKAISYLIPYLVHPDREIRLNVISIFKQQDGDICPMLLEAAKTANLVLANQLMHLIWILDTPTTETVLITLLKEKKCQKTAILLLAHMRSEKVLDDLLALYHLPNLRKPILLAFKRVGESVFFPFILGAWFIDRNQLAEKIIVKIGQPILPYLVKLLNRTSVYAPEQVASMLRKIGPQSVMTDLAAYNRKIPAITTLLKEFSKH